MLRWLLGKEGRRRGRNDGSAAVLVQVRRVRLGKKGKKEGREGGRVSTRVDK